MTDLIAALPMYDWPEVRAQVDAQWVLIRDRLRISGIAAPEYLVRRNADLPPVPGGVLDVDGALLACDPATLPPDELDLHALWLHPQLLFAQTCWGPMEQGLARHVQFVGQPTYEGYEGGERELYSSVILMRVNSVSRRSVPADRRALLPLNLLRGKRFAYNSPDSMSGIIALTRDLQAIGESLDIFAGQIETGAHRASIIAVAKGRADVCTIDCRTWAMALAHEPAASAVGIVGWTAKRKGLPYIMSTKLALLQERVATAIGPNRA